MYNIIEDLQRIKEILVVDLTSGLGTEAYHDSNIKTILLDDKTEVKLPGEQWKPLIEIHSHTIVGYQNIIVRNPSWPSEIIILQDYGNHEGANSPLSFDERVLLPCLMLGSESVGHYDGSISIIYQVSERLYIFKICSDPIKPDIPKLSQKRPTNIHYSLTNDQPDAKVLIGVLFKYANETPEWKEIVIPGLTAWDIHKPSWVSWILSNT